MTTELVANSILGIVIFLYGIVIGSFLNVCILRIPLKESLSKRRSHCMRCGYQLRWFDLVPLFSYLFLGGRCRKCKEHISIQYPIVEGLNGILYVLTFLLNGWSIDLAIYCLLLSSLIVMSVISFRTYEIPIGINIYVLALGLIHLGFHLGDWVALVIGLFAVSSVVEIVYRIIGKKFFSYQVVNFLRVAGLLLGWKLSVISFVIAIILCIIGYFAFKKDKMKSVGTFGSYIAVGTYLAILIGTRI